MTKQIVILLWVFIAGCAVTPVKPDGTPETVPIDQLLAQGARTMWIAPHPDDECFAGSLLARSSIYYNNPLYILTLTRGEGSKCGLKRGCSPDLATVRSQEMINAAKIYRATLQQEDFFNAPLPASSFPAVEELEKIWRQDRDPVRLIAKAIRKFKPDLILTFDPKGGFTEHPEHMLTSRLVLEAIRLAADQNVNIEDLDSHKTKRVYYVLNRYWLLLLVGKGDYGPVTETFDADLPCQDSVSCFDFMVKATKAHRSQYEDMLMVQKHSSVFSPLNLRQVDPFN
jgi:LmbE family N-acetylglucosaminyl deacetylase